MPLILQDVADRVAWSFLGKPYHWGGDDPIEGFDCSGFVIEILKSVGKLPRKGDWTAEGLRKKFEHFEVEYPHRGCLVFWMKDGRAVHVEYMLDEKLSIGASGGWSKTLTEQDAIRHNAYIKVRPVREGHKVFVNPF